MMSDNYMDNNINGFRLPITVEYDCDYLPKLKEKLDEFYNYLKNKCAFNQEDGLIKSIKENNKLIIEAVELNYKGDISSAKNKIREVLKLYIENSNEFIVSELDKNYAFRGVSPFEFLKNDNYDYENQRNYELSFFKARNELVTKREDMVHIPLNKRGLVRTQRFSIAGVPCLYLGTTSYVCWLELDKPNDNNFYVSSYKFNDEGKNLKILNLVIAEGLINGIFNRGMDKEDSIRKTMQLDFLKLWPLVCATSFNVKNGQDGFRSEYVISQLIMQLLKEWNIDGVAYISKKIQDDYDSIYCINLALPVLSFDEGKIYGDICGKLELTSPSNFSSYLKLKNSIIKRKSYLNTIYKKQSEYGFLNKGIQIKFENERIFYEDMLFSDFDNYLVNKEHKNL